MPEPALAAIARPNAICAVPTNLTALADTNQPFQAHSTVRTRARHSQQATQLLIRPLGSVHSWQGQHRCGPMSVAGGGGGRPLSHRVSFLFRRSEGAGVSSPAPC